jgi:hypothetical protein
VESSVGGASHPPVRIGDVVQGRPAASTGDIGAALFAADCLDARAEVPVVDYL